MRIYQLIVGIIVTLLLFCTLCEAKKRKHHRYSDDSSESTKTKTKTKWSSSSNLTPQTKNAMVASEEHGYYVKRTFLPLDSDGKNATGFKSPPFLAIPIAWFACKDSDCFKLNTLNLNSNRNTVSEGFLCDDDCSGPYEPICGKTSSEIAVFYNKCKLNVAKCRSHGYWYDMSYEECKKQYPEEVQYAEMKFSTSPYFRRPVVVTEKQENIAEIASTEKIVADVTPPKEQLSIKELNDTKPVEKMAETKDSYKSIKLASEIIL